MNVAKRRMEIFRILQAEESVDIAEIAAKFEVSTMTIRRDLNVFAKQGLVTMNYGGASLNRGTAVEPSFEVKTSHMIDTKQKIAKAAADLVKEGDAIILDCGTTTLQMVRYLLHKKITILTNSWPVANYLNGNTKVKLILAPGEYISDSAGVFSGITADFFHNYHADKVFIGTYGFDKQCGATVSELFDAEIKRALINGAKERYLLADSSKFGRKYFATHAELSAFDCIFTDEGIGEEGQRELNEVCRRVVAVPCGQDAFD